MSDTSDFGQMSMLDLFRIETEAQTRVLDEHLLGLEHDPQNAEHLETLMRAAHSLKGAARMVGMDIAVHVAHAMEDAFVAAQHQRISLTQQDIDVLLRGVDTLKAIASIRESDFQTWMEFHGDEITALVRMLEALAIGDAPSQGAHTKAAPVAATSTTDSQLHSASMRELFRQEAETQTALLTSGLLGLEANPTDPAMLEALMRAAHSLKGAARMIGLDIGVRIAHAMEDCFVSAQRGDIQLGTDQVDVLLRGVDMLTQLALLDETQDADWSATNAGAIETLVLDLTGVRTGAEAPAAPAPSVAPQVTDAKPPAQTPTVHRDTAIRVGADSLNRLMGLSGEAIVSARWLRPFANALLGVKQRQTELIALLDALTEQLTLSKADDYTMSLLKHAHGKATRCRHVLADRLTDLEEYDRRTCNLSSRLNREVISSRMRPFADGVQGFQRMVRDLSRQLGKEVRLDIRGLNTQVDRDILEKIEAPLNHILRNAVDHGVETPAERTAAGKPAQATIVLEAMHSAGMLSISVVDDGRGIDFNRLRQRVVDKGLVTADMAPQLSEAELTEFLFLPSFSTRDQVTETSGRGVGLDVVHTAIQEMRGVVRATAKTGKGMRFQMQLPLTLSVIRALVVEISGEPYAFPLARIDHTLKLNRQHIETLEGRQYFTLGNHHIGIITASQVLGLEDAPRDEDMPVVVLGERLHRYGVVVDRFIGEHSLVVRTLDTRLGKIKDISAAALLEDGTPALIVDVDDLLRSVDILVAGGRLDKIGRKSAEGVQRHSRKRILVVDDSITIREVERNMLETRGYDVEVAVDGMDGWNAVRTGHYDLVISDIDMPRMNGFEFVGLIKRDDKLKALPVMIVSYKDREEDRQKGLEAGADYYITKGSFHDQTLLTAVNDLIGPA